jgi:hypothetical protein
MEFRQIASNFYACAWFHIVGPARFPAPTSLSTFVGTHFCRKVASMKRVLSATVLSGALATALLASLPARAQSNMDDQLQFFEKHIRPVLVRDCYECHSRDAKEIEGGLTLDTREGVRKGGDRGPAVVPGDLRRSVLIGAIRHTDADLKMPPEKKLSAEVIAQFEEWVAMGAPDPRDGDAAAAGEYAIDIEKGRQFWAFQPPQKAPPPDVKATDWPRTDIDRFLLQAMEAKELKPVGDADARTLVRRLSFDLIGLPPSPEETAGFVSQHASDPQAAVAATVDRLLESTRFGERWGRHWLDVARYAESTGQTVNFAFPYAWRYRDWVIAALNADMPYDQFVRAQLAGDLLPAQHAVERAANLIATGFLAIGPKSVDERNRRQFQMDVVDEQIDATFQAFQALTVACARCHDHRFDPIPQTDYYALAGIFRSTQTCYGTIAVFQSNQPSPLVDLPSAAEVVAGVPPLTESRRETIEQQIDDQRERMADMTGADNFIRRILTQSRVTQLRNQLDSFDAAGDPKRRAMGAREGRASDTALLVRGEIDQPGETVRRGFPQVLTTQQPTIRGRSSGRRELADWIASADNPLTARVMANRVWLHLMGRGLVSSPDNFGAAGQRPSHPELLDHLAVSFVEEGWSVKRLIRTIVLSRAYQLSSRFDAHNFETDPDNVFAWRMPVRRLEAEAIRDTMLLLGGQLDLEPPEGSQIARGGEGNVGFRFFGDPSEADTHRSVYLPIVRNELPEMLTIFDFPDPSLIIGERATTTIPAQALFLMNNPFAIRQAEGMAASLMSDSDADADRVTRAYQLCYSREPTEAETDKALKFVGDYAKRRSERAAWGAFCQALFASAEFAQR